MDVNVVVWLLMLGSAIWVLVDAKSIGVKKGLVSGLGDMGPWAWFFVTLCLWIVGFPMYLSYRGRFKLAVAGAARPIGASGGGLIATNRSESFAIGDLEKLAALKERGLVTEREFEAKKKQLLGL